MTEVFAWTVLHPVAAPRAAAMAGTAKAEAPRDHWGKGRVGPGGRVSGGPWGGTAGPSGWSAAPREPGH